MRLYKTQYEWSIDREQRNFSDLMSSDSSEHEAYD